MHLSIRHVTHYRYSHPVRHTIQVLHLTPRSDPNQQVGRWRIEAPGRLSEFTDAYGNIAHMLTHDAVHEELSIVVSGEAETADTMGVLPGDGDVLPREVFLRPTALTAFEPAVRDFAEPLRGAVAADRLDGLHELSRAVARAVAYRPGATGVDTTAAAALIAGRGVCQDQAHAFTAAARWLGVPTRYVSGYVHVAGDEGEAAASHAWSESWVEALGWVAFDVTNEICANDAHLRIAVGPDYLACAPVRGVRRGGGEEEMDVHVRVAALQQ